MLLRLYIQPWAVVAVCSCMQLDRIVNGTNNLSSLDQHVKCMGSHELGENWLLPPVQHIALDPVNVLLTLLQHTSSNA